MKNLSIYFLKLGFTGFGGPIALVGRMQKDLVPEEFSEKEFLEALSFSQILPGPVAVQTAAYLGLIRGGFFGATFATLGLIMPSFIMVLCLAMLYVQFGSFPVIDKISAGMAAASCVLVGKSAYKLAKISVSKKLIPLFILGLFWILIIKSQIGLLFLIAGLFSLSSNLFSILPFFLIFAKASILVFGSGLAILPVLQHELVGTLVTERQFTDAVSISMLTPGPVLIASTFLGYLVFQTPGAIAATLGAFGPCYLCVLMFASSYSKFSENKHINKCIEGVTAAASGAIVGTVVILAQMSIRSFETLAIAAIVSFCLKYDSWVVPLGGLLSLFLMR